MTTLPAEFQQEYGATLRNMQLNESEIARHTALLTTTGGLDAFTLAQKDFDGIINERNLRVEAKANKTLRRLIGWTCMIIPLMTLLALATWYVKM